MTIVKQTLNMVFWMGVACFVIAFFWIGFAVALTAGSVMWSIIRGMA